MVHLTSADPQLVAGIDQAQGQVGVLSVGAAEPLVEAADADQRRSPHRHVRRDPRRGGELGDVALLVRRGAPGIQRDVDPTLHRGDLARCRREIRDERPAPSGTQQHVVVDEHDPRGAAPRPAGVARRSRARRAATGGHHLEAVAPNVQRRSARPVVAAAPTSGGRTVVEGERVEQPEQAGSAERRHDHVVGDRRCGHR